MRLAWQSSGEVEAGVDRGVLYLAGGAAVPWTGLTSIVESTESAIQVDLYFDGNRFGFAQDSEDFNLSVEAWTWPPQFDSYQGYEDQLEDKQPRKPFGFSYRTMKGKGYLIHLVWNVIAAPTDKTYSSTNESADPSSFNWAFSTVPKPVAGLKPLAHMVVDTNLAPVDAVTALENLIYGTSSTTGTLPDPQDIIELFLEHAVLVITNHGDGTWTAEGPDSVVSYLDPTTFMINWPSVIYVSDDTYTVSSL